MQGHPADNSTTVQIPGLIPAPWQGRPDTVQIRQVSVCGAYIQKAAILRFLWYGKPSHEIPAIGT